MSDTLAPAEADARRELVSAAARLAALGLSPGSSGNLSIRVGDRIIATPTGSSFGALDVDTLSVLDLDGELIAGPRTTKEFPLHRAMFRRDPSARVVVHVHSPSAAAASCLEPWSAESAIPPISPYFVMKVGQTPLIPYADPGDPSQADAVEALDLPFRAALLQNHGLVVAGPDVESALNATIELEEACRLWVVLGDRSPRLLDDAAIQRLTRKYDSFWTPGSAA